MGKRTYTDDDRARVYVEIKANGGNVKRTSRETGIPEATVRDWKLKWDREGVPQTIEDIIPVVLASTTTRYETVMNRALDLALEKLNDPTVKTSARDATWIAAVMTDKVRLLSGEATSRTEQVNSGPTSQEIGEALVTALRKAVTDQESRESEVIDGEIVEQAPVALPVSTS